MPLAWGAWGRGVDCGCDARDPEDPAYSWDLYDPILQRLHDAGIGVLLTLWGTPEWANGGQQPNRMPTSPTSLASFAYAASRKYPWIRRWTVWNEPNLQLFLQPNSPALYVSRLLNPTYRALKEADRGNLVAGGVTSPRRTPSGLSPIAWIRGMRAAHALLDAYAQNPYPVRPNETPSRGGCWHCAEFTMATLPRLIQEVKRDFGSRTRIWLTEYGYNSKPPSRWLGVSNALQARFVGEAALRAYLAPRVDLLIHFLVRDEPSGQRWTSGVSRAAARSSRRSRPTRSPARAGLPPRQPDDALGSGTAAFGTTAVPAPAAPRRSLALGRRDPLDFTGGIRPPRGHGRSGLELRVWSPRDRRYSTVLTIS